MEDIFDSIQNIPFSIFWGKFQEYNKGNYNRNEAFAQWTFITDKKREAAFDMLCTGVYLRGMHPVTYIKLF